MRIVHRAIAGFRLKQAGLKRAAADTGAVTLIQRFGSAANLDIQLHGLVPDGVYRRTGGEPVFQQARALVLKLGLPREMVLRHPFPGPGPGVRILGEVKPEYAALLQRADAVFIEEPRNTPVSPSPLGEGRGEVPANWYDKVAQAFAVFLPMRSVGVMGDGRTYDCVVALRAVQTTDFMTAHWAELPHDLLGRVSNRIISEVRGINRVVYDVSSKPRRPSSGTRGRDGPMGQYPASSASGGAIAARCGRRAARVKSRKKRSVPP